MASAALPYPYQKNWLERNWKWVIALVLAAIVVAACAFVIGIFALLGRSEAAAMAVAEARKNPVLLEKIGQPIEQGFLVTGQINVYNSGGHAELSIPIFGPKGKASLEVEAQKKSGSWTLTTLSAQVAGSSEEINLLGPKDASGSY